MDEKKIVKFCKELGCCDTCCVRYLGIKNPSSYENVHELIQKYLDSDVCDVKSELDTNSYQVNNTNNVSAERDGEEVSDVRETETICDDVPPVKKAKLYVVCVTCVGVLQEETWGECLRAARDELSEKLYECDSIACALSAPVVCALRERALALHLERVAPGYVHSNVTSLKDAWRCTFGRRLSEYCGKRLHSGAVSPLLLTIHMEYDDETRELDTLRTISPNTFTTARRQRDMSYTRRVVQSALDTLTHDALAERAAHWARGPPAPHAPARLTRVSSTHAPLYVAGRYIKLSRTLPQTPWILDGRRVMNTSVQEIICEPLATLYGLSVDEMQTHLKFISAGREDVDVRCLGSGRPFAVEVCDPRRTPTAHELSRACEQMSASGDVLVRELVHVSRDQLAQLKRGEQTKCKTYEALCVKLNGASVSDSDVRAASCVDVVVSQRTPLRVLHRRTLLCRTRRVVCVCARAVQHAPTLLVVRVRTDAGTYVKEYVHGELGRTAPSLATAVGAPLDILALDVTDVELEWPPPPNN